MALSYFLAMSITATFNWSSVMDEPGALAQEEACFRAILTPNRSLSPRGFVILMSAISFISFIVGLVFFVAGAWPVMGFCGLDVFLIYWAFRLNYRSGRAFETVELYPKTLILTRVDPNGRQEVLDFNPYWVRVLLSEWPDGRTILRLVSHGREVVVGHFLSDDERRGFAGALKFELEKGRRA